MDANIQKKIEELTISVEKRNRRYRRSMITTGVIYAVLVLFVFCYTTIIYSQISNLSTPENLSQFLVNTARDQFPTVREGIRERMQPAAAFIAREGVAGGISMIPSVGAYARGTVDEQVDGVLDSFEEKDMPDVENILDEGVAEVLAGNGPKDADTISRELNKKVSSRINQRLDKVINGDFYGSVSSLRTKTDALRDKDPNTLTSRDFAKRQFIFSWLRMNDISEIGNEDTTLFSTVSGVTNSLSKNLSKEREENK